MSSNLNVDFKPDPTQEVGMSWHDKKALFEQEAANLTTDPNAITKAEKQFKLHEEGVAGWNTKGAHTAVNGKDKSNDAKLAAKNGVRDMGAQAASSNDLQQSMATLSSAFIKVTDGFLQENGRTVSLDRKMELEAESEQNSTGLTEEEVAMEEYMQGKTDIVPDILKQMAEERGISNPNGAPLTRADYAEIIHAELPDHIAGRITGGGINVENGQDLLPSAPEAANLAVQTPLPPVAPGLT